MDEIQDEIVRMPEVVRSSCKCRTFIYGELKLNKFPRKALSEKEQSDYRNDKYKLIYAQMINGVEYKPE